MLVSDFLANYTGKKKSCSNQRKKQTPLNKGKMNTITNPPFCFTSTGEWLVRVYVLHYGISAEAVTWWTCWQ